MGELTQILQRAEEGDPVATEQILPLVYEELRYLANQRIRHELPGQTIQATELVHEAFLRLLGEGQPWQNRSHFLAAVGEAMRRILVERARKKARIKHGGKLNRVPMENWVFSHERSCEEIVEVDDLLDKFAESHPTEAQIVKLHFFAGFSIAECANALGIARSTAHERWKFARAWLHRELRR